MGVSPHDPSIKRALAKGLIPKDQVKDVEAAKANAEVGKQAVEQIRGWCREYGWPEPVTEYRFSPKRKWQWDVAWVDLKVAIEFQGGVYNPNNPGRHMRPQGFASDCEKFSSGAAMGWRCLPVTYKQVKDGHLLQWLKAIMGESGVPVFTLKATDPIASTVLLEHARDCEDIEYPKVYVERLLDASYAFRAWQASHPTRVSDVA